MAVALRRKQPRKAHRRGGGAPEEHTRNVRGTNIMRILIAFEDDYCAYADALAKAIRAARPHLDVVAMVGLEALQTQTARLDPHLVISSVPNPAAEQEDGEVGAERSDPLDDLGSRYSRHAAVQDRGGEPEPRLRQEGNGCEC